MKIDVKHVAKLANLTLSTEEESRFEKQLEETLTYIEQLQEVDTENIAITPQVTGLENVSDEDVARPSLSSEDALSNTEKKHNGMFLVKAILDSD